MLDRAYLSSYLIQLYLLILPLIVSDINGFGLIVRIHECRRIEPNLIHRLMAFQSTFFLALFWFLFRRLEFCRIRWLIVECCHFWLFPVHFLQHVHTVLSPYFILSAHTRWDKPIRWLSIEWGNPDRTNLLCQRGWGFAWEFTIVCISSNTTSCNICIRIILSGFVNHYTPSTVVLPSPLIYSYATNSICCILIQ